MSLQECLKRQTIIKNYPFQQHNLFFDDLVRHSAFFFLLQDLINQFQLFTWTIQFALNEEEVIIVVHFSTF